MPFVKRVKEEVRYLLHIGSVRTQEVKLCDDKKIRLNMVFRANMQTSLYHRLRSLSHNPNECFYFGALKKLKREIKQNSSFG